MGFGGDFGGGGCKDGRVDLGGKESECDGVHCMQFPNNNSSVFRGNQRITLHYRKMDGADEEGKATDAPHSATERSRLPFLACILTFFMKVNMLFLQMHYTMLKMLE